MSSSDPIDRFRLTGRAVVVTGASSGLGAHFARVLDAAGARLLLVARREDRLRDIARELRDARVLAADLANPVDVQRVSEAVTQVFDRVDVLVNTAGTADFVPATEESQEEFDRVLAVNLRAPFAMCQVAARSMMKSRSGGSIINVASILGIVGSGRMPQAAYHASKGGLVSLTRELAAQWARHGIRVNALAPGFFPTELTQSLFDSERGLEWLNRSALLGRTGRMEELDGPLLLLASDAGSFITGHVLVVDGGWTAV